MPITLLLGVLLTLGSGWDARVAAVEADAAGSVAGSPPHSASGHSGETPTGSLAGRWSWPLAPPHRVVRGYDQPAASWSPGHRGVDLSSVAGAAVTAPDDGVVHFAGVVVDRPVLSIEHTDGVLSSFEPVVAAVKTGDAVTRGQIVGHVAPGHCSDAPCLHLGARVDGRYVSPLLLLGAVQRAVLLPTRPVG